MSGRLIQRGSEAGAQTPPLLRASSPLKPKNQLRTNIVIGTANGGTSPRPPSRAFSATLIFYPAIGAGCCAWRGKSAATDGFVRGLPVAAAAVSGVHRWLADHFAPAG